MASQSLVTNEVASFSDMDKTWMQCTGMDMGPFGVMDMTGLETFYAVMSHWAQANEDQQLRKNADYIKVYFFMPRFNLPDLIYIETLNMLIKTQGKEAPMKKTRLDNPSAMMAAVLLALSSAVLAQSNLPFPKTPSASTAGITLQESEHHWRQQPNRLPDDAPNIIIILTDDTGFGNPSTFGGPINTPTLTRLANEGIMYNSFHTTATCSPTRASLLTGRNRHRVGYGQISEFAGRFDEG